MKIVDTIIYKLIYRKLSETLVRITINITKPLEKDIRLYYPSQMNSKCKQIEINQKSIIETNLYPVDEKKTYIYIQTLIYYKKQKSQQSFGNFRKVGNLKKNSLSRCPSDIHALRKCVNPTNHIMDTQLHLSNSK